MRRMVFWFYSDQGFWMMENRLKEEGYTYRVVNSTIIVDEPTQDLLNFAEDLGAVVYDEEE